MGAGIRAGVAGRHVAVIRALFRGDSRSRGGVETGCRGFSGQAAQREYVAYLLERRGDLAAAYEGAAQIASRAGPEDRETLLAYIDRALDAGEGEGAAEIWNQMCRKGLTPYAPLARGQLVNGDFGRTTLNRGFDWRGGDSGVRVAAQTHSGGDALELFLSGSQPENCEIYSQFLHLAEDAGYVLRYQYRTGELGIPRD